MLYGVSGQSAPAVDDATRERMRTVMFERVLGRDDEEGLGERVGHAVDTDRVIAHRLEERGLRLRARSIHFVRQHEVAEDRPGLKTEGRGRPGIRGLGHRHPEQIPWQEVTRELDAAELAVDGSREGLGEGRLADTRDVVEEDMALRDQTE